MTLDTLPVTDAQRDAAQAHGRVLRPVMRGDDLLVSAGEADILIAPDGTVKRRYDKDSISALIARKHAAGRLLPD
jgi:putative N-acetylmannosamine-6-phosphate epimerase